MAKQHIPQPHDKYKTLCGRDNNPSNEWGLDACETCLRIEALAEKKRHKR